MKEKNQPFQNTSLGGWTAKWYIINMRKTKLATGETYHIFNRGVDKRNIFSNQKDVDRFFHSMSVFNQIEATGSLYEQSFQKDKPEKALVKFVAYNLLSNHFHFIIEQVEEDGISKFMQRLLGGYTWYFNNRYKRSGSLFQGRFKSVHIHSNEYLLHVSAYVNLNHKIKLLGGPTAKLGESSWDEYIGQDKSDFCAGKDIVLDQFNSKKEYGKFALSSLEDIKLNKQKYKELEE